MEVYDIKNMIFLINGKMSQSLLSDQWNIYAKNQLIYGSLTINQVRAGLMGDLNKKGQ